jgi:hypothetical protein
MLEGCEIEQKQLKGNSVVKTGTGRYKLISNDTFNKPSFDHLQVRNHGTYAICITYNVEPTSYSLFGCPQHVDSLYQFEPNSSLTYVEAPKVIDEKILIADSFAKKTWQNTLALYSENREEAALAFLYESLHDEIENFSNCDSFLGTSLEMAMNSDVIVHILNALSPIKSKLQNWDEFTLVSFESLKREVGADTAKILMNAAV